MEDTNPFSIQLKLLQAELDVHYVVKGMQLSGRNDITPESGTKEDSRSTRITRDTPESEYNYLVTNLQVWEFNRVAPLSERPVNQMYVAILCIFKWALDTVYPQIKSELKAIDARENEIQAKQRR